MANDNKYLITTKYHITTSDGETHEVSKENIDKYGMAAYASDYPGATIRMRDNAGADYDIPLKHYDAAVGKGLRVYTTHYPANASQRKVDTKNRVTSGGGDIRTTTPPAAPASKGAANTSDKPAARSGDERAQNAPASEGKAVGGGDTAGRDKGGWQPSEQDKVRVAYETDQMLRSWRELTRGKPWDGGGVIGKARRMAERGTVEGRRKLKAAEWQARAAGAPVSVMGLSPGAGSPQSGAAGGGTAEAAHSKGERGRESGVSPVPYGVKYVDGKAVTEWVLPDGSLTTDYMEADSAEFWARQARLRDQFEKRMAKNGLDPAKEEDVKKQAGLDAESVARERLAPVLDAVWAEAEEEDRREDERYRREMDKAASGAGGNIRAFGPDGMPLTTGEEYRGRMERAVRHKETFNLDKMAEKMMKNLPEAYRDDTLRGYRDYFAQHKEELKGRRVEEAAMDGLRSEVYAAVYERAVAEKMPKSKTEFLMRKILDQPLLSEAQAMDMASSALTRSWGMAGAEMDAMVRYGEDHQGLDIAGTIAGMAMDPTTYAAGAVGGAAAGQALKAVGKAMTRRGVTAEVAARVAGSTLTGRIAAGVAGGAGNFAFFEGAKNLQGQLAMGGTVNPETGEREFSVGDVFKAAGHGMIVGGVTGVLSPVLGNVGDKIVRGTASTAGKVGVRGAELATSTLLEGTIFAASEYLSPENTKSWGDVWRSNMAMILGFKLSHGIKAAPAVIASLRPIKDPQTREERNHNRMGFRELVRRAMDPANFQTMTRADAHRMQEAMRFTGDELAELRRMGYGELADVFAYDPVHKEIREREREVSGPRAEALARNHSGDGGGAEGAWHEDAEFDGFAAMEALMEDRDVSQAVRAKAYYILTGRMLPAGTVTGWTSARDGEGRFIVNAMTQDGEVVTSRVFENEASARREMNAINRQAELNSVDVGERFSEALARETGKEEYWPEAIRAELGEEYGMSVDDVLRKMPEDRSAEEQRLIDNYLGRLFPEEATRRERETEQLRIEASAHYDEGADIYERMDEGDEEAAGEWEGLAQRAGEARERCKEVFGDDPEAWVAHIEEDAFGVAMDEGLTDEQRMAALEYANAMAAIEGANDALEESVEKKKEEAAAAIERRTHRDRGDVVRVRMKVDDREVFVVKGDLEVYEDDEGVTRVSAGESSGSLVIMDGESGEYDFTSADRIDRVESVSDPEEERRLAFEAIDGEHDDFFIEPAVPEDFDPVAAYDAMAEGEPLAEARDLNKTGTPEGVGKVEDDVDMGSDPGTDTGMGSEPGTDADPQAGPALTDDGKGADMGADTSNGGDAAVGAAAGSALSRIPVDDKGEPQFTAVDAETGWDGLVEAMEGVDNALPIAKQMITDAEKRFNKKPPTPKSANLSGKGGPMAMRAEQMRVEAANAKAKEDYERAKEQAKAEADAWRGIVGVYEDRQAQALRQQAEQEADALRQGRNAGIAGGEASGDFPQKNIIKSEERDDNGLLLILSSDGTTTFGKIRSGEGIQPLPIKLSEGFNKKDLKGNNIGYGLEHIEAGHGAEIRDNGFKSVVEFVEFVSKGYDRILIGNTRKNGTQTYLIELKDAKSNTLFIELSKDGQYWTVNSGGIFRSNYTEKKKPVEPLPAVEASPVAADEKVQEQGDIPMSGNSSSTGSDGKVNSLSTDKQAEGGKSLGNGELRDKAIGLRDLMNEALDWINNRYGTDYSGIDSLIRWAVTKGGIKALDRIADNYLFPYDAARFKRELREYNSINKKISEIEGAAVGNSDKTGGEGGGGLSGNGGGDVARGGDSARGGGAVRVGAGTLNDSREGNDVKPVGKGKFGDIFAAFRGKAKAAWEYLSALKSGQARGVFYRPEIGEIDLVWGDAPTPYSGKGLAHIDRKHVKTLGDFTSMEEAIGVIDDVVKNGEFTEQDANTAVFDKGDYRVVVARDESGNWVLTAFDNKTPAKEKKKRKKDAATRGTAGQPDEGARAVAPNPSSGGKGNTLSGNKQGKGAESSLGERIAVAEQDVDLSPTEAQKEAGNYRKGHVQIGTFDITIENPAGSKRSGTDAGGKKWETTMTHAYGYIRGTESADGDPLDVFLSSDIDGWNGRKVYVVDQYNPDGTFDEHKVMLGFNDRDEAFDAYLSNYEDGWENGRRLEITESNVEDFEKWIGSSKRKIKAFADYKNIKTIEVEIGHSLTEEEAKSILSQMENIAEEAPDIAFTPENWKMLFGEDGKISTPLGVVKMGENQYGKLALRERTSYFGMIHPTLTEPHVIIEKNAPAKEAERNSKYLFVRTFKKPNGGRIVHFESITVMRDGMEVSISSHEAEGKAIKKEMQNGKILHLSETLSLSSERYLTEAPGKSEGPDLVPTSDNNISVGKGNTLSADKQTVDAESFIGYTITPTKYTNKRGKTSDVWLVKFDGKLSKEEKAALDGFARGPLTEGRKISRGWYDRKEKGYMMRSEEAARELGNLIGDEDAVADGQPLSREDISRAAMASVPEEGKQGGDSSHADKTAALAEKPKRGAVNRVSLEDVMSDLSLKGEAKLGDHAEDLTPYDKPATQSGSPQAGSALTERVDARGGEMAGHTENEKVGQAEKAGGQFEVTDEMRALEDEISRLLSIDDEERSRDSYFRDPDELTPEQKQKVFALGVKYAFIFFDNHVTSFSDFAKGVVGRLGQKVKPFIKAWYEGAKRVPGYGGEGYTDSVEVDRFDIENFDKPSPDLIRDAEMRVAERKAKQAAQQADKELIAERNEKRKKDEQQTAADTAALAEEAEAVASEAEAIADSAKDERAVAETSEKVDKALDKINNQLAILGYFERKGEDPTAVVERKAAEAGADLAARLVDDLGLKLADLPKGINVASADFGEKGGYVRINLPVRSGYEPLRIDIRFDRTDNGSLRLTELMTTIKRGDDQSYLIGEDHKAWLSAPTYGELVGTVREQIGKYLPKEEAPSDKPAAQRGGGRRESHDGYKRGDEVMWDRYGNGKWEKVKIEDFDADGSPIFEGVNGVMSEKGDWSRVKPADGFFGEAERVATKAQEERKKEKGAGKGRKSGKKAVTLQADEPVGGLFADIFVEPETPKNNEKRNGDKPSKGVAGGELAHAVGSDETGTDGGLPTAGTEPSDKGGAVDAKGAGMERGADGPAHGADADGGLQSFLGDRGRDESRADRGSDGASMERGGTTGKGTGPGRGAERGGEGLSEGESSAGAGGGSGSSAVKKAKKPAARYTRNFRYDEKEGNEADSYTSSERLEANVKAVETLAEVLFGGKPATDEQRVIMSRFRGWGQVDLRRYYDIDQILRNTYSHDPINRLARVIKRLDPQGEMKLFEAIKGASLTSYYTPTPIARAMNSFLGLAGYKGGALLDPSMGNGMYEGTLPKSMQERTAITGVELDWLSGQLSRQLYPDANVIIGGFEKSGIAPGSYDVVTSNVPFGDIAVYDPSWKNDATPLKRSAQNRIHNYYAVKMLEATRPGGLVSILTTSAVMDTPSNQNIRAHIADQGEILGAIRLPDNTFQGTGVVTDILFIRKWRDDRDRAMTREQAAYKELERAFLSHFERTAPNKLDGKEEKVELNGYFEKNPDNIIGEIQAGNQYGKRDAFGLTSKLTVDEIASEIEKAVKRIVGSRRGSLFNPTRSAREVHQAVREEYRGDGDWVSGGNLVVQDGKVGVVTAKKNEYGEVTRTFEASKATFRKKELERTQAMIDLRTAMKKLIAGQIEGKNEEELRGMRGELQAAYDNFVGKYGRLHDKGNSFILDDIDGYTLQALEKWKDGKFLGLSDIFTKNSIKPALKLEGKRTPQEAVALSLAEYGYLRPDYLAKALGENWAQECGDFVFLKPNSEDDYVTRDEYLSGDVVSKLAEARAAAERDRAFERNVKALEEVQPARIAFDDIAIHLGARWIPESILNDFVNEIFGIRAVRSGRGGRWDAEKREYVYDQKSGVRYLPETDSFEINIDKKELGGEAQDWETPKKSAKDILKAALEDKSLLIKRKDKDGNEHVDEEQTELVNQKIADLRERFETWLPGDPERVEELEQVYNDRFNRTVIRHFDGSHLAVPGLMGKELREHQKDAIWMLINNRGGIVDHIVGAGKTLVMQSAIMEMRRMGIARKPLIVALKSTVSQIAREFKESFPSARVLAPSDKDFKKENRKRFFANIALNDYDCIILSHEQYCKLPHTEEAERAVIDEQLWQLNNMIAYLYGTDDKSQMTKRQIKALETRKKNLEAKLAQRLDRSVDREFCFENLGIDYMFVDESHQFKSLPYVTSYDKVAGLGDPKGSDRAVALLTGIRHLQRMHQGDKGTVFLSGTTITNSLVEIYNLLNYLRPRKLEELGMPTFDAWASTFAVHSAELEAGVTGQFAMKDRFRSFDNVPELSGLYAEIADVRNDLNLKLPKPGVDGRTVIVPASETMQEINAEIVHMLENKDGGYFGIRPKDPQKFPWGLRASSLSANAAVTPRLIFPDADDDGGKVHAVCENVKKSYDEMSEHKGVQLIFCELGVPGKGKEYDAYTDMIGRLVNDYGIPKEEIAYIQQAPTEEKRKALFQRVRDGKVRILIGGTKNMGTGVNVQDRITDMHMLTVPWTPAALEQCIGRGSRQGNLVARDFMGDKVRVHYYATEGSLDLYKYQLLDAKGKMFTQFKMGTVGGERSFDEGSADEDGNLDPAEMVAILSGNPVIFERAKQEKKVKKLRALRNGFERDYQRKKAKLETLTEKKGKLERLVRLNERDVKDLEREGFVKNGKGVYPSEVMVIEGSSMYGGRRFDKPKEAGEYILDLLSKGKNVTLAGFGKRARVVIVNEETDGLFASHYELQMGDGKSEIKYTTALPTDPTSAGLVFRSLLEKVMRVGGIYSRDLEETKNKLNGLNTGDGVFQRQGELDEAVARLRELNAEYNKLGKKQETSGDGKTQFMDPAPEMEKELTGRETDPGLKEQKALELSEKLGLPIRLNRTDEEVGRLTSGRQRMALGFYSRGEELAGRAGVTINLPNLATVRDVVKVIFHEGVWHKGIRLFCKTEQERDRLMDHLYENSSEGVRREIEAIEAEMFERAKDELSRDEKFLKAHSKPGERIYAGSPVAVALAHVEARNRRAAGEYMRDATEEFGARVQEEVEENGYDRMRADKLSFWKRVVNFMEKAMGAILRGLKIRMPWKYGRKEYQAMGSLFESTLREQAPEGPLREAERMARRYGKERGAEQTMKEEREAVRKEAVADRIEELFNQAVSGDLKGKPVEVGRLTEAGRMYLEKLSGIEMKEDVSFVLNPSDLVHMYRDHFADNEKDKGNNIPLNKEDIRMIGEIICNPERIVYGVEPDGLKRNLFYFLSSTNGGTYNLLEIYGDRKGNLTAKTFYKTKKAVSQRVLSLLKSEHLTSVTDGASLSDDAKLPKFFEYPKSEGEDEKIFFRDPDMDLDEVITNMKVEAMRANADDLQAKKDAMRAIGGNLNKLRRAMARQREYDVATAKSIKDLARVLMDNGLMDDLGKAEVKSLLAQVTDAIGRKDIGKQVDRVMDIMVDNQLRLGESAFGRLLSVRGSRVDARGIQVQGELDADGAAILKIVKSWKNVPSETYDAAGNLMPGCILARMQSAMDAMSDPYAPIAERAALEYAGLQIAREYSENIRGSEQSEKVLREEIRKAREEKAAGRMTKDACRQAVDALLAAIRDIKLDRISAFEALIEKLGGEMQESVARAKAWREAERERVNAIHHLANSDMQGRELRGDREDTRLMKLRNHWLASWILEPMSTLDQMLKMFGRKNPNGEGYMHNYFMRGWIDAADKEQEMKEAMHKQMDDKAAEIFGGHRVWYNGGVKRVDYTYSDIYGYAEALPKVAVTYYDGGGEREYEIGQGVLLYLYAVEKMAMGRATNRRMDIDDATMANITSALDPKLKEYADWAQDTLLPQLGDIANEVYERMFGTAMDMIENYFPFVRDENALEREVENGQTTQPNDRISVQTGAIKKRVASVAKWDMRRCNFFDVLANHVDVFTHWISFAELDRDFGTLLSYNRLKQQVFRMNSVYGAGEQLWKRFKECCAIATDAYDPKRGKFDQATVQVTKGVAMGKIALRPFTALKQTLSLPAFLGEVNLGYLAADIGTLGILAVRWAWRNMPNFRKRILSRTAGDYRLKENEYDGKIMKASSYGMLPNIGVDAWTIAIGSHGVYKTRKAKYLRWGMDKAQAERRAVQDAELCYNKSQQSSEGPFMAPVQMDHTAFATSAMLFRNSSTSYTREAYASARNLKRLISGEVDEDYVAKQILRTLHPEGEGAWTDEQWAKARKNAKREIRSAYVRNTVNLAMFGWILAWLWRIGGKAPMLLLSGDDEEKEKELSDATLQSTFAPVEGLVYGDVITDGLNILTGADERSITRLGRSNPFLSDLWEVVDKVADKDTLGAANDVINILVGMATGVNPQTITDWTVAIIDYNSDAQTRRECALLVARLLSCPPSQLEKVYFEELDMDALEASKLTPREIAERYARYKMMREAPLTGWMRSKEGADSIREKRVKGVLKVAKEKLEKGTNAATSLQIPKLMDELKATRARIREIEGVEDDDRRYELWDEFEKTAEYGRYWDLRDYKRDMDALTKRWLEAGSAGEREEVTREILERKGALVDLLGLERAQ